MFIKPKLNIKKYLRNVELKYLEKNQVKKIVKSVKQKFLFKTLHLLVTKKTFKLFLFLKKKPLKIKKNKKKIYIIKIKKKKFLNFFLKFFLLDNYSLFNFLQRDKRKNLIINKLKKKYNLKYNLKKKKFLLHVSVHSNNIFINFLKYSKIHKRLLVIKFWSTGLLKLHCTKRQLKFTLYTLLKEIRLQLKALPIFIIKIMCAPFLYKHLYKMFKKLNFKANFIIYNSFKIFNGCRNKKKRRKKHLKFRILK